MLKSTIPDFQVLQQFFCRREKNLSIESKFMVEARVDRVERHRSFPFKVKGVEEGTGSAKKTTDILWGKKVGNCLHQIWNFVKKN